MKKIIFSSALSFLLINVSFAQVNIKELPRQYNEPRSIEWSKDGKYFVVTSFSKRDAETYSMIDGTTTVYSGSADTIIQARTHEAALCATLNPVNKEITTITYSNGILKFNLGD
ncbi:MAG TPA: hypothetical protein VNX68_00060, partial [Nitrosopumilaceae archaeon]|nr:hypothetical protein [Nitrosopumilaceae archaeon]